MQYLTSVGSFLLILGNSLLAQNANVAYEDFLSGADFQSLQAFVTGNEVSYPAIELNSDQTLTIQFDELSSQAGDYQYQVIHCNSDWTSSDLFTDEYMSGFNENPIRDYDFSINTTVSYVNYRVALPNNEVQFKISGNYIFRVFKEPDRDSTLLIKRFVVYEPITSVDAQVIRPLGIDVSETSQEIGLRVLLHGLEVTDPFTDVNIYIAQNNRPDKVLSGIKPTFVRDGELVYTMPGQNVFQGSNEFRMFSFTNINRMGLNVNDVQYADEGYHVQLRLDESRNAKKYFWEEEMNGKFIVNLQKAADSYRSADYAWIYFSLPYEQPILDGTVYVFGAFSSWKCQPEFQMHYNFDQQMYETELFLKQGYYNYMYALVDNYTFQINESRFEGTHYQTENDYVIYVYYHPRNGTYDRLVGYRVINSKYQ
ncbi:MAG TPA: hypothetical protein DCQ26_05650 [Marinilabiliales bacterium]|jgi:hypothetical protein|nr:MAG: hypothetical protein A2W95_05540 [Bacteroidetes bacterium GWA2_40_14]OFX62501.1 MAG: hypothetical protein A2W84_02865 [Bacteroidetes bacterium GWC2_40_13]OFX74007.1 MAG: hypothetical protein A2W96_11880 [Bacteroidetes bacterium GWD2_40_43]OFX93158.1 MAG: hypothetical protein A2W97_06190 [Bacteroidetes bacterium GWE2_40_63]OFY21528.1 MAG: hypothetical protein A2W88_10190 [Bacteroidetes bacterium GWF2_40_13]OFZ24181.1 MAG: hypothetical protein A2437_17325 [Bacteroidetes bacterium RIFOXYC